ncbi:hypothetical protein SAMN05216588_109173 [Pseudomonas flavescens]|uniref:Uncharacterized protein n=1 Tax=Phytopseudomonas flavescens TaxID=29435 RepID=A0A1G8GSV9_9GAMM|nr:hypothetical protein SAMN05216588_109173 [Pseudomonas flavescens]
MYFTGLRIRKPSNCSKSVRWGDVSPPLGSIARPHRGLDIHREADVHPSTAAASKACDDSGELNTRGDRLAVKELSDSVLSATAACEFDDQTLYAQDGNGMAFPVAIPCYVRLRFRARRLICAWRSAALCKARRQHNGCSFCSVTPVWSSVVLEKRRWLACRPTRGSKRSLRSLARAHARPLNKR